MSIVFSHRLQREQICSQHVGHVRISFESIFERQWQVLLFSRKSKDASVSILPSWIKEWMRREEIQIEPLSEQPCTPATHVTLTSYGNFYDTPLDLIPFFDQDTSDAVCPEDAIDWRALVRRQLMHRKLARQDTIPMNVGGTTRLFEIVDAQSPTSTFSVDEHTHIAYVDTAPLYPSPVPFFLHTTQAAHFQEILALHQRQIPFSPCYAMVLSGPPFCGKRTLLAHILSRLPVYRCQLDLIALLSANTPRDIRLIYERARRKSTSPAFSMSIVVVHHADWLHTPQDPQHPLNLVHFQDHEWTSQHQHDALVALQHELTQVELYSQKILTIFVVANERDLPRFRPPVSHHVHLPLPDLDQRITVLTHRHPALSFAATQTLAQQTGGLDLAALASEGLSGDAPRGDPLEFPLFQPMTVPLADCAGYAHVKTQLAKCLIYPLRHREAYERLHLPLPTGVLLYGPPGCGKTRLVHAFLRELQLPAIQLKASDVFSPFLGDSEKALRQAFLQARRLAPAILYLDELHTLAGRRDWQENDGGTGVAQRVLSQLLNEMDGLSEHSGWVMVVACTQTLSSIDDALLRPGRFDVTVLVDRPSFDDRVQLLNYFLQGRCRVPLDVSELAARTEGYTCRDLERLVVRACMILLRSNGEGPNWVHLKEPLSLEMMHLEAALKDQ